MSSQEQNDRHIIWSDISLDLDDWRESLEELYPGYSDDELYDIMVKSNAENLYDERVNLNIQLSQPIIVIGDLGRWNGRVSGYKMIDSGNIKDCLYSDTDYTEWYVDKYGDLRADGIDRFAESLSLAENDLENIKNQLETAKKEVQKPFSQEEELRTKLARLDELNILLNMDKRDNEIVGGEPDEGEVPNTRKEKTYER